MIILFVVLLTSFPALTTSVTFPNNWEDDPYHHIANMDSKGNYVLEWVVNISTKTVLFKATVKTLGYIGFGVTSKGKMRGADLIICGISGGKPYLYDMHVADSTIRQPLLDESQDYTLESAWENGTHTSISFSRPFETCDDQDHKINDDSIRFIWAYGRSDNISQYHYQFRGEYQTYVLDPDYTPREIQEAKRVGREITQSELGDMRIWTITRRQLIPPVDTAYWCSFHKGPVLSKKHHLVGFNYRWENEIQLRHTHHMMLSRCRAPEGVDPVSFFEPYIQNNTGEMCYFLNRVGGDPNQSRMPYRNCREIMYSYSYGGRMFFLPPHAGISFGDSPDEYFLLQIHYDNPNINSNLIYDAHIDLYYTPDLRENEAGVLTIGHHIPGSPALLVPPMSLEAKIYGHCGSPCTSAMFPPEGINVMAVQQHTHNSGIRHRAHHFRGNKELPWIIDDNNYENLFQDTRFLRSETKILPGDQVITRCVYNNVWTRGAAVVGGFSTRQEMCSIFIWYYNKVATPICRSEISSREYTWKHLGVRNYTWRDSALEYVVTEPEELEGLTLGRVATDLIDWTEERRAELERDHKNLPQINNCENRAQLLAGETMSTWTRYPTVEQDYKPIDESETKCALPRIFA